VNDALFDAVSRIARHEADTRSWASIGVITEVHPSAAVANDHAVSVKLRDSGIVVPKLPVAVGALGFVATPAVNDLVVVVFAEGDPHSGVVVGRLYSTDTEPPEHSDGQVVLKLPPGGSPVIDLLLDPATPELKLIVKDTTVTLDGSKVTIKTGDSEFIVDGSGSGAVTVKAADSTIELASGGSMKLEASSKLELKAPEVTIEGSGKVKISGGMVEVN
jgi:phage baseplate assembly protein gpV